MPRPPLEPLYSETKQPTCQVYVSSDVKGRGLRTLQGDWDATTIPFVRVALQSASSPLSLRSLFWLVLRDGVGFRV